MSKRCPNCGNVVCKCFSSPCCGMPIVDIDLTYSAHCDWCGRNWNE